MASEFNPYLKWLGIPPHEQPPNHYRLLGIELFESDAEEIALAANRRVLQIQSMKTGNPALVKRIIDEIADAADCLLDPEKKDGYDVALQLQIEAQPPTWTPSPLVMEKHLTPPPVAPPTPAKPEDAEENAIPVAAVKEAFGVIFKFLRRHKRVLSTITKLVCAAAVIVIILHGFCTWKRTLDFCL